MVSPTSLRRVNFESSRAEFYNINFYKNFVLSFYYFLNGIHMLPALPYSVHFLHVHRTWVASGTRKGKFV
jgi:hypothetical protein